MARLIFDKRHDWLMSVYHLLFTKREFWHVNYSPRNKCRVCLKKITKGVYKIWCTRDKSNWESEEVWGAPVATPLDIKK